MIYYDIAVNYPKVDSILTYKSQTLFEGGDLVLVPLGKRSEKGCVIGKKENWKEEDAKFEIKEIIAPLDPFLKINQDLLRLLKWTSRYYHYPLGRLVFDVLPKALKRPRPLKGLEGRGEPLGFDCTLSQGEVIHGISSYLEGGYSSSFIHGVTGSGKTAVYLEIIKKVMDEGKSVLFLLPEINLTKQFLRVFEKHIEGGLYSYNSALKNSDKFGLWKLLEDVDGAPLLVLGSRSSVFLPFQNLGLIIVDEEHDGSFKQEDRCPYHARNIAIKRAQFLSIPVVLGSATPSTEMLKLFQSQGEHYYTMKTRVADAVLPQIQLVDIREKDAGDNWPLAIESIEAIAGALEKGEQVIVFINRLGYANYLQCRFCGYQFFCKNCSIPLKYFKSKKRMVCQHCEYTEPSPLGCPECSNLNLLQKGFGTEKVENVLKNLFPQQVVRRFDREELPNIKRIEQRLDEFHRGEIDILVGTQMLSKGHNFKRVNLVLVLGTDVQLSYPDFRSQEKVFQQISQISGRAGRFSSHGRVLIQTVMPGAKIYDYIVKNDGDSFYFEELNLRREFAYPPYTKMMIFYVSSRFSGKAQGDAEKLTNLLCSLQKEHFGEVNILGPRICNIEKRANQFTQMILLKSSSINELHNLVSSARIHFQPQSGSTIKLDIDPVQIL